MAKYLTDSDEFPSHVLVYERSSDPWGSHVIDYPVQQLANRTTYLKNRADGWNLYTLDALAFNEKTATAVDVLPVDMDWDAQQALPQFVPGTPVRVLDHGGTIIVAGITTSHDFTGLNSTVLDHVGRLWVKSQGPGLPMLFYKNSLMTSSFLIAISEVLAGAGTYNVIEQNDSGLGGTITIAGDAVDTNVIEFYKWGVVGAAAVGGGVDWYGPELSLVADDIWHVWSSSQDKVIQADFFVSGSYALVAETDLLRDIAKTKFVWKNKPARVARVSVYADNAGGGADINVSITNPTTGTDNVLLDGAGAGINVAVARTEYTSVDVDPLNYRVQYGDVLEIATTIGNANDTDLTVSLALVVE